MQIFFFFFNSEIFEKITPSSKGEIPFLKLEKGGGCVKKIKHEICLIHMYSYDVSLKISNIFSGQAKRRAKIYRWVQFFSGPEA